MKQQLFKKIHRKESQLSWDSRSLGRSHSELILSAASQKRGGAPLLQKKKIVLFQDVEVSSGFSDAGTHAIESNEASLSANLDFSQWYAQAGDAVVSDVSSHVSTPYSGDASNPKDFLVHGDQNSVGLSNLAIALLGLVGIGGVVALASSKGSSSSTPDTTTPTVQSLNANATAGTVTLNFSESLDPLHLPLASAFDIRTGVALASNPVISIEVSDNSLILHLSNSFVSGQISISYLDASSANDVNTIQDIAGNDAQSFVTGTVADGYISGAQIYIDVNGNGIPDVSELLAGVVTDANGNFFLPSNAPLGAIIAVGGINVDTNLAQLTPLKAPIGSLTINPITHLIQSIIDESSLSGTVIDALDAADRVATAFGISLPSGASLLSFNPLAGSSVDGYSLLAQKVAAQISSLTVLSSSGDQGTAFLVMNSLADFILSQPNSPVDLSDSADVNQILLPIFSDGASRVADVVAANTAIENVNSFGEITAEQTTHLSAATQSALYLAQIQSASALDSNAPNTEVRAMGGSNINTNDLNLGLAGVEGTTDPLTLVHLQLAPGLHKSIYSDSLGEWRYSFSSSDVAYMGQGIKNILCWTVAAAGNRGEVTRVPLFIDTIAPTALLQSRVNETTHELINASSDNDSTPTFKIIAEAGSVVKVKDGLGSYKTLGIGTGSAQEYSISLDAFQGLHKLTFRVLDAAGNYQEQSYDYVLDSIAPQVTMNASAGTINHGAATLISFSFDQAPTAFSASNLEVRGGTMSALTGSGTTWAGTFTADSDLSTRNASVSIAQGFLHDSVGNASEAATKTIYVVTPLPSISPDLGVINADLAKESLIDMIMRLVIVELEKIPFAINLSDVAAYIQDHLYVTLPGNGSFEIDYVANPNDAAFIAVPLDINLGIPGLNLDVQSATPLELVLDCEINISGGYDSSGLYLNTSTGADPCVQISAEVSTDEALTVTGTLGPLSISAVNNNTFADVAATLSLISDGDNRLYWDELLDVISNPENIGRIFDARVDATQNLSFLIQSEVDTGVGLLDSFIPNFSFIATASATEHGDINAASLTYAADLALTEARITSDVLSDVVVPFLQTTEKVIAPLYPMVDFFHSPLPWQVQTYQNTTSLPSGWDIINPEAWFDYAKGAAKAGLSSGIDSVIQDLYASMDIDEDGQVQFIEVMQAPVQFGMTILENGESIIDDLQEVIREIQDSPAASAAEWAAKATLIGAAIGGVVGGALSGSLGTAAAIAISLNADTLLAQTEKIKGDLENLHTLMTNINAGIDALEIVLSKIEDFRSLTQMLTTNEDSGSGITMDGILLGSYGYHIEGGLNGYTVTEGTPNNPILTQLVDSQYIPPSQSYEVPAYTGILADLQNIGIEIPLLTERNLLGKLISLQPIDLLTYSPDLPTVNLSFDSDVDLVAVGQDVANVIQAFGLPGIGEAYTQATKIISIFANLETQFFGSLTLDPNIDFGIDTAGVNSWFTNGMPLDYSGLLYLADGLYASDHLTSANSGGGVVTTDNPEFTISSTLGLSNTLNIGWPFVGGQLDVATELLGQLLLDVNDPNDDGKLRLSEILANIESNDPLLNIGDPSYLDFKVSGEGSAWLDFSKPIPVSALKSLGIDSGILNAIADAASWITSAAENRYSLDIPYAAQWRLIGTTSDAVIQI